MSSEIEGACLQLVDAVRMLLPHLDVDGTCQVCEQGWKFHALWCPLHEVNIALDRLNHLGSN